MRTSMGLDRSPFDSVVMLISCRIVQKYAILGARPVLSRSSRLREHGIVSEHAYRTAQEADLEPAGRRGTDRGQGSGARVGYLGGYDPSRPARARPDGEVAAGPWGCA